ncbi:MAG: hypothetical protein KAH86_06230 [Methanosarcinales archaeon]|nr:hypothetical protein [Methanosarcinales archaeon]
MRNIELNTQSIKVNPENYIAMTDGYQVDNKMVQSPIHISDSGTHCNFWNIYKNGSSDYFLLTCYEGTAPQQPANSKVVNKWAHGGLCDVVRHRDGTINIKDYYQTIYKYAACVDKIYHIKGESMVCKNLFGELCSNGLFNQWNYVAPCNRLTGIQCRDAQIDLLRIYNLRNPIIRDKLWTHENGNSRYWDELHDDVRDAYIIDPVIPDDKFDAMRIKLESSLNKHGALIKTING